MAFKITYYEFIELTPSELKARLPLITIIRYTIYHLVMLILFVKNLFRLNFLKNIFKKTEEYKGRENNDIFVSIKLPTNNKVIKTKTVFFHKKNAQRALEILKEDGIVSEDFYKSLNKNFILKKREEYIEGEGVDKYYVYKSYPKFVLKINKIIKDIKLF